MAISNNVLINSAQPAANIFVSAGASGDAVTTMYFCNRTAASTTFNLHIVPAGFVANANNIVYSNKTITAGDTYIIDWEKLVLAKGDTIRANANTGNAIVSTISTIGV